MCMPCSIHSCPLRRPYARSRQGREQKFEQRATEHRIGRSQTALHPHLRPGTSNIHQSASLPGASLYRRPLRIVAGL